MNLDFKVLRELPIVDLLQTLWYTIMTLRYEHQRQSTTCTEQYTPYCISEFNGHRLEARQHQVQIASSTEARIAGGTPYGTRYHVNLQTKICTY